MLAPCSYTARVYLDTTLSNPDGWLAGSTAVTVTGSDLSTGCSGANAVCITATPSSGTSPLSVTLNAHWDGTGRGTSALDFGDGSPTITPTWPNGDHTMSPYAHQYATPGTYTATLTLHIGGNDYIGTVRVIVTGGTTALAPQSTQLASALTALQNALQSLLHLLQ